MSKKLISAVAAATLGASALATPVMAEVSATAGVVSDYVYRGSRLGDAAANASIDYSNDSGISAGIWGIQDDGVVTNGLEVDIYASYAHEFSDAVSASVGFTRYEYTGNRTNFESEVNLGLAINAFSLAIDMGEMDANNDSDPMDYMHYALSWGGEVYAATVGAYESDDNIDKNDTNYFEVSASGEVSDLDMSIALGKSTDGTDGGSDGGYLVLSASKTFDL